MGLAAAPDLKSALAFTDGRDGSAEPAVRPCFAVRTPARLNAVTKVPTTGQEEAAARGASLPCLGPLLRDPCYPFLVPVFQRMHPQNLELGWLENGHRWGTETSQLKYISKLELGVLQGPHPKEGVSALLEHPWHWSQPLCSPLPLERLGAQGEWPADWALRYPRWPAEGAKGLVCGRGRKGGTGQCLDSSISGAMQVPGTGLRRGQLSRGTGD